MPPLTDNRRRALIGQFLANVNEQDEATDLQRRAQDELARRLVGWYGDFDPNPTQYSKNRSPVTNFNAVRVLADPTELMIIRAISMTFPAAQFGISPSGEIFTAHGNGWTIRGPRIYVSRLSWLLDEAADHFNHLRANRGGRFYESDGNFFMADGRLTFMRVINTEGEINFADQRWLLRHPQRTLGDITKLHSSSRTRQNATEPTESRRMQCSLHEVELSESGTCAPCAELITPPETKPWWRFW